MVTGGMTPSWNEAHEQLKSFMQREINMMREILANMHQEELSLLMNDKDGWQKVMENRSDMIIQLSTLRNQREMAKDALHQIMVQGAEGKKLHFEELLKRIEEGGELLSLLDQILALVERINLQNCRNESLFHQAKTQEKLPLHCPYPPPYLKESKKVQRKTSLATYPKKRK
ncbi:MAG: hypothetical protein L0207_04635 [Chlamydiae bacterium]|nr:hypothetical protein [Chlamydiota bacterium]